MTIDDAARRPPAMDDVTGLPSTPAASGGQGFEGQVEFMQCLRGAMARVTEHGTRRICWCDDDFAAWPLGEPEWISLLTHWARAAGRELVMIAHDYAVVERRHPRFAAWRRDWSHVIRCLVPEDTHTEALPTLWIDSDDQALRVFDREHLRGRIGFDRVDRQRAREDFDAISQRASAGFSVGTLGL